MQYCHLLIWLISLVLFASTGLGCSSPAQIHNEQGITAINHQKFDEAVKEFETALGYEPDNEGVRINLAKSLLLVQQPQRTIDTLQPLLEKYPRHLEVRLIMAQAYWNLQKAQESEQLIADLLPKDPSTSVDPSVYMVLAEFKKEQKQYAKAVEYYQKAIELVPDSDMAYTRLAQVYLLQEMQQMRDISSARLNPSHPTTALPSDLTMLPTPSSMPLSDPTIPSADSTMPSAIEPMSQRQWMIQMGNLMASGGLQLGPCKAALRKAIYLNPNNLEAHMLLGMLSYQTGAYDEAELEFIEASRLAPNYPQLYVALASVAQMQKKWDKAERHLDKAEELLPDSPIPLTARVLFFVDQKQYNQALDQALKTIQKFGNESKVVIYQAMSQQPEIHIPWLISQLDNTTPGAKEFCSEALSALTGQPLSQDRQTWQTWWKSKTTPPTFTMPPHPPTLEQNPVAPEPANPNKK